MNPVREDPPLVSAIVSTYKAERFMPGLLTDLEGQTIADRMEIVVVDSNSPQNEGAVVKEFQRRYDNIVYLRTEERENSHVSFSRAIQLARGKYVTLANTDDRRRADALERMAEALESRPQVALAYADMAITLRENDTFETAREKKFFLWPEFDPVLFFQICYVGSQPMWRRALHEVYGYFDPEFWSAGDYEFWLRLIRSEKFLHIPEILGLYLFSPQSNENRDRLLSSKESEKARERYWPSGWGKRPTPFTRNPFVVPDLSREGRLEQVRVLKQQGVYFSSQGDGLGSEKAFQLALAIDPLDPDVLVSLGKICLDAKRFSEAIDFFRGVIQQKPLDKDAHMGLLLAAQKLQDQKAAEEAYSKASLLAPEDPAVQSIGRVLAQKKGRKYSREGPSQEAKKLNQWGEALFHQGKMDEALELFGKSRERDKNYLPAINNLGVVYFHSGDPEKAGDLFRQALEIDPHYKDAAENLERCSGIKPDPGQENRAGRADRLPIPR